MKSKEEQVLDTLIRLSYPELIDGDVTNIIRYGQFGELVEDISDIYANQLKDNNVIN
jgi:hypothetical protein